MSSSMSTSSTSSGPAFCIDFLRKRGFRMFQSKTFYQAQVLLFTYVAYTSYHLSRRPLAVVKSVFHHQSCNINVPGGTIITKDNLTTWCDWHPFEGETGNALLGTTDSIYLFSYAIFMFLSGWLAERMNLRYFLALGMIFSGLFTYVFGLAFYYNIHSYSFFVVTQIILGAFQSTGWPACVATVGNWFGHSSKRGFILGIWNSHTNVGNVLGAVIAGAYVNYNWGLSFMVPGLLIAISGFILFLFLVPYPQEVDMPSLNNHSTQAKTLSSASTSELDENYSVDETTQLLSNDNAPLQNNLTPTRSAISIFDALKVPGVIEYSASLFFSKLVSYTFLYWLPKYIEESTKLGPELSAYMSVPFDVGGLLGAIVAGYLADVTGASGLVCIVMLALLFPALVAYFLMSAGSLLTNILLQTIIGIMVNGPYCLITTSVSADLGNRVTSSDAMATITAIIDGTGSVGAAVGPLIAGLVADSGWNNVFYMVMIADLISMCLLARIGKADLLNLKSRLRLTLQERRERRERETRENGNTSAIA